MRWNAGLATVVLIASLAGCRQQTYLTETDFQQFRSPTALMPLDLESNPHDAIYPGSSNMPPPMTVLDTNRPPRPITLAECIAIALEQGTVGSQNPLFPGTANDTLVSFAGRFLAGSDALRVLALDPAIAASDIESALARFDARWVTSMTWSHTDQAINNILQSFQNGDSANFNTGLFKPLPSGGLAGITYSLDYTFLTQVPAAQVTNPSYRPRLQFLFEQPLLQFFGVEINQLNTIQPGSILIPGLRPAGGTRTEGILITRLRFDQQRAEFERAINYMLYNVETAYWNLYGAYYVLYSREQGLQQAMLTWQINRQRYQTGLIPEQELQQVRAQYEAFRAERIQALGQVLERERQLRNLMGLPIEDGTRLVPADEPTLAAYQPDWYSAVNEALALRPELILARQDLKFRQLDLIAQKNQLKPDLRFFATYDINGLGTRLDGGPVRFNIEPDPVFGQPIAIEQPGNALASFTDNIFNSWQLGLRMDMPLGFRDAHAAVRNARLNLQRSYLQLKDQERRVQNLVGLQHRQVVQFYEEIGAQRSSRLASTRQLELLIARFEVGRDPLLVVLDAQRNLANALASEYTAIVNYNNALAGYHWAKGTIMQYDNVSIAEGPLPACAQVRAVEHIRQRDIALKLRERADPAVYQAACNVPDNAAILPLLSGHVPPAPATPDAAPPALPTPSASLPPALPDGR